MKTLDEIMVECQSDKASVFTRTYAKPHNYCVHLERFFEPLRDKPIKLLEIGTGGGESMRAWLSYFTNAHVYGVDIVSNTNEWNAPGAKTHPRYTFACGDQSDLKFWNKFIEVYGGDWDIICDDGSHVSSDMITTFGCLWPHVTAGGIYEAEDLNSAPEAAQWFSGVASAATLGHADIDSIYFSKELAILRKK